MKKHDFTPLIAERDGWYCSVCGKDVEEYYSVWEKYGKRTLHTDENGFSYTNVALEQTDFDRMTYITQDIPKRRGGKQVLDNLVFICPKCSRQRGNRNMTIGELKAWKAEHHE